MRSAVGIPCLQAEEDVNLMLNSLAKSLTVAPSATAACQEIDRALHLAGLPSTWNQ